MENILRNRLQERLSALKMNPFEAARKAGFERSMINDLLIGKKKTIRQGKLEAIASALECDPEYLAGFQPRPRKQADDPLAPSGSLPLQGICEADAWREPPAADDLDVMPISPDPRFPSDMQSAFIVRGNHAAGFGIDDGTILCAVDARAVDDVRDGEFVIVARSRFEAVELTARKVAIGRSGLSLIAAPGHGSAPPLREDDDTKITAVILRAIRVFGVSL